ncbi:MAG: hypothetical protein AAFX99_13920, partial [Myxococcota bacterium]
YTRLYAPLLDNPQGLLADILVDEAEEDTLEELVEQLALPASWSEAALLRTHAVASCREAALLSGFEQVRQRAMAIGAQIPKAIQPQVFGMLIAVSVSDRELAEGEGKLLTAFAEVFALTEEEAELIYNETLEALGLVEGEA